MKLAVISHTAHYRDENGEVCGLEPTVRELSRLAPLFERVVHLAPLHDGPPPVAFVPYSVPTVELRPLRPTGGDGWAAKWGIVRYLPTLLGEIHRLYGEVDLLHVRAPANIAATALLYLDGRRASKPCWVKYAGNWSPEATTDFLSYRWQRRRLQVPRPGRAVTVNGRRPDDGGHVHGFLNPCLTAEEWAACEKVAKFKAFSDPLRLLFVGRLDEQKGVLRAVRIARRLQASGLSVELTVAGDGAEAGAVEAAARQGDGIRWVGRQSRTGLDRLYGAAHFLLLPSAAEGWPKVLAEAMAHGTLPVAGDVSAIGRTLRDLRRSVGSEEDFGWTLPPRNEDGFVELIRRLWVEQREGLSVRAGMAWQSVGVFTYEAHVERVRKLFVESLGVDALLPTSAGR